MNLRRLNIPKKQEDNEIIEDDDIRKSAVIKHEEIISEVIKNVTAKLFKD